MTLFATAVAALALGMTSPTKAAPQDQTPGSLEFHDKAGRTIFCPLQGTKVDADIAGFGARVTVKQTFVNPSNEPIEAIYTFPLPTDAAVDRMSMRIGDRFIDGQIKRKEEARAIYEAAKSQGRTASLLDQERPNIFTQSVANLMPGGKIEIEISYVEILKFENGSFEFSYPMVVGPRYVDERTTDPNKITPPITPKGTRTGAGIDLNVKIDAGMTIENVTSKLHEIQVWKPDARHATVKLAKHDEIPNRDFILNYQVAGKQMKSAFLSYADAKNGGFFTMILMPPKAPNADQVAPKEVIFVMDQSGSQQGFPIEKSKELTKKLIDTLNPNDTFNVLSFNTQCTMLWKEPRRFSEANRAESHAFVSRLQANGGTNLVEALQGALSPASDKTRRRLIVFNTDGYIGNDFQALDAIVKSPSNARVFTFGIGNAVNRFLIEGMSREGRGDAEIITLAEDADKAAERFIQRTRYPVLMDVQAKFEGVQVADVMPNRIPDVFGDHPIILRGRYLSPGKGRLVLKGQLGGDQDWVQTINLNLPDLPGGAFSLEEPLQANAGDPDPTEIPDVESNQAPLRQGSAIATLWARAMVDEVSREDYMAIQQGRSESKVAGKITRLGLAFGLMTQFTSFVAVENRVVNVNGKSRKVRVPVEMPDGVSYEGIFGAAHELNRSSRGQLSGGQGLVPASGGFGGGGGGNFGATGPPTTAAKSSNLNVKYADADVSRMIVVDGPSFDKLTDAQVASIQMPRGSEQESNLLKPLNEKQRERYYLLTRVDKKLRESKLANVEVQIVLGESTDELKAALTTAGLKIDLFDKGIKAAFGSCSKSKLAKLAAIKGVLSIKSL